MPKRTKPRLQTSPTLRRTQSAPTPHSDPYLGAFSQAPVYLQDNPYISRGYRIGYDSPKKVLPTLFMLHNETLNIWTHLLGTIILFFFIFEAVAYGMESSHILAKLIIKQSTTPYKINATHSTHIHSTNSLCDLLQSGSINTECETINIDSSAASPSTRVFDETIPTWPIMVCLLGGAICLACSTVFHLMHPMDQKSFDAYHSLDFAGIGINMAFSPVPAFYYAMYCTPTIAMTYILIITLAGIASFAFSLFNWFHREQNLLIKITVYAFSAIICAIGLSHIIINEFIYNNYGDNFTILPALPFFICTLLTYLSGFCIYCYKCPQRFKPGHFDICGHSHQLWHLCVFLAAVLTYLGSLATYQIRSQYALCPLQPFPL